ncbi:MAG: radical SAM protein, partial [Candidatus Woesearchaeota archaeon]
SIEKPKPNRSKELKKINKNLIVFTAIKELGYNPTNKYKNLKKIIKKKEIDIGHNCNNRCRFCLHKDEKEWRKKSTDKIKKDIECTKNFDKIVFTGGEPTMRKDLPTLIKHAKNEGFKIIELESNGRRFFYNDYTQKIISSGVTKFKISLHGSTAKIHEELTRTADSFSQTIKGIKNLVNLDQVVAVNCVITKHNYKDLPNLADLLININVSQIKFIFPNKNNVTNFQEIKNNIPKIGEIKPYLNKALNKIENQDKIGLTEGVTISNQDR